MKVKLKRLANHRKRGEATQVKQKNSTRIKGPQASRGVHISICARFAPGQTILNRQLER